ncbi:MAG TPA: BatA and WFA domain-containing protein [Trueperaceae bacterium]
MSLSFLAPQFLWALLALPLIVVLHFLRTRRRPRVVSALFLWRRARQAAESRRRFSPTWLLLLQLLFATMAALALARPAISLQGPPDRVLVIDASASMMALDDRGVRLERAVREAEELLAGGSRVALVRAGLEARVLAPLDSDRAQLREALRTLRAGDRSADLARALELAGSLLPAGEVHLFSDGPVPAGEFFLHPVAGEALNYGVTTFDVGIGQAYVAVTSSDPRPQQLQLELLRDGELLAATEILVPGSGQGNATLPLGTEAGLLEARLRVPEWDALPLDDAAYAGKRALRVVVEEDSGPVLRALDALPGTEARVSPSPAQVPADVRVTFGPLPDPLPTGNVLSFAAPAEQPEYRTVRDWAQADELFRFVDLRETVVGLAPEMRPPVEEGWETLARAADLTPVISRFRDTERTIVRVAFHPSQTDMVLRPAFPAFVANVMTSFRGQASLPLGSSLPEGSTLDGREVEVALEPGIYETPAGPVAASLLSAAETSLPAAAAAAPDNRSGTTSADLVETSRGLWLALVIVASTLLLLEWIGWSRGGVGWVRGG